MVDKIELKPCPFCGGKAELEHDNDDFDTFIFCNECGSRGAKYYSLKNYLRKTPQENAATSWNTRHGDSA